MDQKQVHERIDVFELTRPNLWVFWDGTFHGKTDPAGPIGPQRPTDISNGF